MKKYYDKKLKIVINYLQFKNYFFFHLKKIIFNLLIVKKKKKNNRKKIFSLFIKILNKQII